MNPKSAKNPAAEERQFKQLFHELRQTDEASAPAFDQVWLAAQAPTTSTAVVWFKVAAVTATILLCLLNGFLLRQPTPASSLLNPSATGEHSARATDLPWQSLVLVSQWQSPTDFLLKPPEEQWWQPASSAGEPSDATGGATLPKQN